MSQVDSPCKCGCHQRHREAGIKRREASKRGKFYYYHEDCDCCGIMLGFGTLLRADSNDCQVR